MKVGLLDVDGHNFPNLPLMKLSEWHKQNGDEVEVYFPFYNYDRVYMSKVFSSSPDYQYQIRAEIIKGGSGYCIELVDGKEVYHAERDANLPDEIEHIMPDYSLYGTKTAYGFLSRGCIRKCPFCHVSSKEGKTRKVADLTEWWGGWQKDIMLLDPNILACRERIDLLGQLADSKAWVDFSQGIDARLLTGENLEALNRVRHKTIHFAWDLMEQSEKVVEGLKMYAEYGRVKDTHKRCVYVLTNYDTSMEQNLYRVEKIRSLGLDPYIMVYDKQNAPKEVKRLQRYVNNKFIFYSKDCRTFDEYQKKEGLI